MIKIAAWFFLTLSLGACAGPNGEAPRLAPLSGQSPGYGGSSGGLTAGSSDFNRKAIPY